MASECRVRWTRICWCNAASWAHLGGGVCCGAQGATEFDNSEIGTHSSVAFEDRTAGLSDNSPGKFWKHWHKEMTQLLQSKGCTARRESAAGRPFSVCSGPRVQHCPSCVTEHIRWVQWTVGTALPKLCYWTHFQFGVFGFTYVIVLKIACVIHARSDCGKGRIPSTVFRQQKTWTHTQARSADTRVHGAALSFGPSCRQDGDRYFERLQPAAKILLLFVAVAATTAVCRCCCYYCCLSLLLLLLLFVAVAATTAVGCCCFEGISYVVICAEELWTLPPYLFHTNIYYVSAQFRQPVHHLGVYFTNVM